MTEAPPQNLDAEAAILGTVLLAPKTLAAMIAPPHGLRPAHFYRTSRGSMFAAMIGLHERGEGIDEITVRAECEKLSVPNAGEEVAAVYGVGASNWPDYVKVVKATARRRQVIEAGYLLLEAGQDDKSALIAEAERILADHESSASIYTPERQADDFLEGNLAPVICPWPWDKFNELTGGGIRAAQTTFWGGWTNHGKSPAVDQVLLNGRARGLKVALYINEMSPPERSMRFAAQLTDAGFERIRDGELDEAERLRVANTLNGQSIPILNAADWSAEDVCRDIRRSGWDLVGVDGLHMFPHEGESDLSRMALAFAQCAKATGCHIQLVGHLNEKRAEIAELPPPVLRDIRGSGHIKNAMDFVAFVWREQTEAGFPMPQGRLYLAKGRNSRLGGVSARYDGDHMAWDA